MKLTSLCSDVISFFFQVKTETSADLNVLHEQKSKAATEEHERLVDGNVPNTCFHHIFNVLNTFHIMFRSHERAVI